MLRHGAAARQAIRLDSAAAARAAYAPDHRKMLGHYGWGARQFTPLNSLWNRESGWNKYAANPYSGAYGIRRRCRAARWPRRPALADQRDHPDPLGAALHQEPLRLTRRRLGA